jgi:hypothetical protein
VDGRKEGRKEGIYRGRGSNRIPQNNRLSFAYAPDNNIRKSKYLIVLDDI